MGCVAQDCFNKIDRSRFVHADCWRFKGRVAGLVFQCMMLHLCAWWRCMGFLRRFHVLFQPPEQKENIYYHVYYRTTIILSDLVRLGYAPTLQRTGWGVFTC